MTLSRRIKTLIDVLERRRVQKTNYMQEMHKALFTPHEGLKMTLEQKHINQGEALAIGYIVNELKDIHVGPRGAFPP